MENMNIPCTRDLTNEMEIIENLLDWSKLLGREWNISSREFAEIVNNTDKSAVAVVNAVREAIVKVLMRKLELRNNSPKNQSTLDKISKMLHSLMSGRKFARQMKSVKNRGERIEKTLAKLKQCHWDMKYAENEIEKEKKEYRTIDAIARQLKTDSPEFVINMLDKRRLRSAETVSSVRKEYNGLRPEEKELKRIIKRLVEKQENKLHQRIQRSLDMIVDNLRSAMGTYTFAWSDPLLSRSDIFDCRGMTEAVLSKHNQTYSFHKVAHSIPDASRSMIGRLEKMGIPCTWARRQ
ncbi:hypothetical protein ScPMuIL_013383 [Solemya velum]